MTHKIIALLVAGGAIGSPVADAIAQRSIEKGAPAESVRPNDAVSADDAALLSISVRQTKAATVVYSEYSGPYWGVGPVLRRVHADMTAAHIRGATFIRFPDDPRARTSVPAATLVGYFAEPGVRPDGAYVVGHWKPVLVVATTVRGSNTATNTLYPQMRAWATSNGYTVLGPIIEVFEPMAPGATVDEQRTEIRMPVRPRSDPNVTALRPSTPGPTTLAKQAVEPGAIEPPAQNAAPHPEATAAALADRTPADKILPSVEEATNGPTPNYGADSAVSEALSFEVLIDLGRYDEAMDAAWPQGTRLDEESLGRLDQIASRVRAIATAFTDQDTEAAARVGALADALNTALSRLSDGADSPGGSPSGAAVFDPAAAREALQALDRLMVRIGQRRVDATQCLAELHRLLVLAGK